MIWGLLIIVAAGILMLAVVTGSGKRPARRKQRTSRLDYDLVRSRWAEVEQMSKNGGLGLKGAITEADKLLDYVMKGQGARGETMAERLKSSQPRLSDKEAVWQAHKLRNHLNHEVGFEVVASHAREAINAYGRALKDLGALK